MNINQPWERKQLSQYSLGVLVTRSLRTLQRYTLASRYTGIAQVRGSLKRYRPFTHHVLRKGDAASANQMLALNPRDLGPLSLVRSAHHSETGYSVTSLGSLAQVGGGIRKWRCC